MQTVAEIDRMTDDEIRGRIAQLSINTSAGVAFWYRELAQREARRSGVRAERLTWVAVALAATAVIIGIVQLAVAVAQ
jgi:hypothetical protein